MVRIGQDKLFNADQFKAASDIVWRSRGALTAFLLADFIRNPLFKAEDAPQFLRAFDFQVESNGEEGKGEEGKEAALVKLAFGDFGDPAKTTFINTEANNRLRNHRVSRPRL